MSLKECWEEVATERGEEEIEHFIHGNRKRKEFQGRLGQHIIL